MKPSEWAPEAIRRVADTSGKPLEVTCAEAFLRAGWQARLGTHYADGSLEEVRELDVLAEKRVERVGAPSYCLRVLLSCRGFPAARAPLAYVVSRTSVPPSKPRLLFAQRV